jgi:hypothetical protein
VVGFLEGSILYAKLQDFLCYTGFKCRALLEAKPVVDYMHRRQEKSPFDQEIPFKWKGTFGFSDSYLAHIF